MSKYNDDIETKGSIELLSYVDLKILMRNCKKQIMERERTNLERKIIFELKYKYKNYSQLATFADGFRIEKYDKYVIDNVIYYLFELSFCGMSPTCTNSCVHLKIKSTGNTFDKISGITEFDCISYNLGSDPVDYDFGKIDEDNSYILSDALEKIIKTYSFEHLIIKESVKSCFGYSIQTTNVLDGFFVDILRILQESLTKINL